MPVYTYKARNDLGRTVNGTMEAATEDDLVNRLRRMNFVPVNIAEAPTAVAQESKSDTLFLQRVRSDSLIMFTVQLTSMVSAGIPLLSAVNVIARQMEDAELREVLDRVVSDIAGGMSFSEALAGHPGVFSRLYISMIRAGETGGVMEAVLKRLATYLEEQENLRQTIQGALFYPMILVTVGVAVVLFIVSVVIPQFALIFSRADIPLPLPTRLLYAFGLGLQKYWFVFIGVGVGTVWGLRMWASSTGGRLKVDQMMLAMPVAGSLVRQVIVSRFCRTLATLLESGVPMLQALDIMRDVVSNEVFARTIDGARRSVEQGERLDQPLKLSGEFPGDALHMISVGEEAGKLGYMLNKAADAYDTRIGYSVKRLTTLIEPIFIMIMGVVVGFIMASMLIPIFDMVKTIHR